MRRGPFLIDAGFLVGLMNADDRAHEACVAAWKQVQGPFVSTEGVLVEAAWLLRRSPRAVEGALGLMRTVAVLAAPIPWRYARAVELMAIYRDVPMDLVDALLVAISEELRCRDILSLDARGFDTYRTGGKPFRRVP